MSGEEALNGNQFYIKRSPAPKGRNNGDWTQTVTYDLLRDEEGGMADVAVRHGGLQIDHTRPTVMYDDDPHYDGESVSHISDATNQTRLESLETPPDRKYFKGHEFTQGEMIRERIDRWDRESPEAQAAAREGSSKVFYAGFTRNTRAMAPKMLALAQQDTHRWFGLDRELKPSGDLSAHSLGMTQNFERRGLAETSVDTPTNAISWEQPRDVTAPRSESAGGTAGVVPENEVRQARGMLRRMIRGDRRPKTTENFQQTQFEGF